MQIDERRLDARIAAGSGDGSSVQRDVGIIVLNADGRVISINDCARRQLGTDSAPRLGALTAGLVRSLAGRSGGIASSEGVGPLDVRVCETGTIGVPFRVLLLQDPGAATERVWEQASIYRGRSSLLRDWAHDFKGILHVMHMNQVLAARVGDDGAADTALRRKCLDGIARCVVQMERAIDVVFRVRPLAASTVFDAADTCRELLQLLESRASRQRVKVDLVSSGGSTKVRGTEDRLRCALLGILVNALDAMEDGGRLLVTVDGGRAGVVVRVCDTGPGMAPELRSRLSSSDFAPTAGESGIGLPVACAIVRAHSGSLGAMPNPPRGTCVVVTLPPATST